MPINKQNTKSAAYKAGLEQPAFVKVEGLTLYNGKVTLPCPCGDVEERVDVIFTRGEDNTIDNAIALAST